MRSATAQWPLHILDDLPVELRLDAFRQERLLLHGIPLHAPVPHVLFFYESNRGYAIEYERYFLGGGAGSQAVGRIDRVPDLGDVGGDIANGRSPPVHARLYIVA